MAHILNRISNSGRRALGILTPPKWAPCCTASLSLSLANSATGGGDGKPKKGMALLDTEEDFAGHKLDDAGDDYGHEAVNTSRVRGIDIMRDPHTNKVTVKVLEL
jgi:hypothetical protein